MTSRLSLFGLPVLLSVLQVACADSSSPTSSTPTYVTDTLGQVFSVSCSTSFCTLTPTDSDLKALSCDSEQNAADAFTLIWGTRVLTAHAVSVPTSGSISLNAAEPAHPIACATDADCLPTMFTPAYTCQEGLCQYVSAAAPMKTVDVIALCQADIPWPKDCPYLTSPMFANRMAEVAALCGSASQCAHVPPDCRQPTAVASGLDASAAPTTPAVDSGS